MSRNREPRELQFTSAQLVIVFILIIALGAFIFILGVSVGKKQARLSEGPLPMRKVAVEKVAPKTKLPVESKVKAGGETQPGTVKPTPSVGGAPKSDIQQEIASFKAQPKTTQTTDQGTKPAASKTQPAAQPKPRAAEAKTQPAASKTKTAPQAAVPAANLQAKLPATLFFIQVTAAPQKEEALRLAGSIKNYGFTAIVLDPFPTDRSPYYRVRVGGYQSEEERSLAAEKLAAALGKKTSDFYYPPPEKNK
jgi:cell division septation protein DedD